MPKRTTAEKEEAKRLREEKKKARELKKAAGAGSASSASSSTTTTSSSTTTTQLRAAGRTKSVAGPCHLLELPEDSLSQVLCYLAAKELGAVCSTCRTMNRHLPAMRVRHLLDRLRQVVNHADAGSSTTTKASTGIRICDGEEETRAILAQSLVGGGNTGRVVTKKSAEGIGADEYPAYARFIEEAVCGYALQNQGKDLLLPNHVNGRFVSTSPEHTIVRTGGHVGGGVGGGVVAWGVGKRGQLGHGQRQDRARPQPLTALSPLVRIVQVSAGGGLVRVAHTLFLTSDGRVLSCGTAQYGQLGHGYSAGRQLSDELRPRYVEALRHLRVVAVSAGELHSAAVTDEGDLYAWGDGFCGQLGVGSKRPHLLPQQVTGLADECVSIVSCGHRHTLCVTEDGDLFAWGLGHYGALGRTYTPFEYDSEDVTVSSTDDDPATTAPPPHPNGHITPAMAVHLDLLANLTLDDHSDQCIPVLVDALAGIHIVGACAGHRHSMVLDNKGNLYTFGNGSAGELGHGDLEKREFPFRVEHFAQTNTRIAQFSAGVDFSMAVCARGHVYSWGQARGGRLGLTTTETSSQHVTFPRRVSSLPVPAVDVECGYIHSIVVGVDGTLYECGKVGVDGADDGVSSSDGGGGGDDDGGGGTKGKPALVADINIWHRTPKPSSTVKKERWKKYGTYEPKGRSKMMEEVDKWNL